MIKNMQPARVPGTSGVPSVQSIKYKTGEVIVIGSLVLTDANGELNLCGADPASILGVALEKAASKPGWDAANSPTVITGRVQEVSVAIANRQTVFTGRAENAGVITNPDQTQIGKKYGVINNGGEWRIDLAEAVNTRLEVVDVDLTNNVWFFKFLEANLQSP